MSFSYLTGRLCLEISSCTGIHAEKVRGLADCLTDPPHVPKSIQRGSKLGCNDGKSCQNIQAFLHAQQSRTPCHKLDKSQPHGLPTSIMYACDTLSLHLLRSKHENSASNTWGLLGSLVAAFHCQTGFFPPPGLISNSTSRVLFSSCSWPITAFPGMLFLDAHIPIFVSSLHSLLGSPTVSRWIDLMPGRTPDI
ncbi:hypothetical protein GE21DRAFT_1065661 [Neurospora crassa]|nr:hypothetical protein GE21DRAFT_1065661 [Neurospora crassa]